jgi:agmatinase
LQTTVVVFPFDLFGSGGSGAGAELLAEELREVIADNKREQTPTRARVYTPHVRLREFGFETLDDYQTWRPRARQAVRQLVQRGDFLVWLTGNHLGALPVYDELSGEEDVLVLQLDAHLDIHQFTGYSAEPSHGNFLLHCDGPLPPIINVGHRELLLTPDSINKHYRATYSSERLAVAPDAVLRDVRAAALEAGRIFLDLDCDVLDPAYFPAVSRPVPFGLSAQQVLRVLDAVPAERLAGLIVSEFDPGRDRDDRSLTTLVWLLEHLLIRRYESL